MFHNDEGIGSVAFSFVGVVPILFVVFLHGDGDLLNPIVVSC